jgi:hypothetical protein
MNVNVNFEESNMSLDADFGEVQLLTKPGGGIGFEIDATLTLKDGILSVNTEEINAMSDEEIARLVSIMQ